MKKFILFFSFGLLQCSFSPSSETNSVISPNDDVYGQQGPKFAYDEYDVLFTNPECKEYLYAPDQAVVSNAGNPLRGKPVGAFCSQSDGERSGARESSPQHKLISWINEPSTQEIFFTYLSFSNKPVLNALCNAITERNVKVTFVLDKGTDVKRANELLACKPENGLAEHEPKLYLRGGTPGLGLAHNKIFIVNPHSEKVSIAFSSGNLSSGALLHHENWHFIKTNQQTYFTKSHLCVMDAEINAANSAKEFIASVKACRDGSGLQEESDMKVYFIPGDGDGGTQTKRAGAVLEYATSQAQNIAVAAHRFSYKKFNAALDAALQKQVPVRFISDDDIWWVGTERKTGPNTFNEYEHVTALQKSGMNVKYMETNHREFLLHHNKFVIFNMADPQFSAVFAGAGNFTGSAFKENWENYYYIRIPKVVEAFNKQYEYMWSISTAQQDLPKKNVLPSQSN